MSEEQLWKQTPSPLPVPSLPPSPPFVKSEMFSWFCSKLELDRLVCDGLALPSAGALRNQSNAFLILDQRDLIHPEDQSRVLLYSHDAKITPET